MRYLLCVLGLLFAAESAAQSPGPTPAFISQADGSVKLVPISIPGATGLMYVCLGSYAEPRKLLCLVIQPDGSVLQVPVTRVDIET